MRITKFDLVFKILVYSNIMKKEIFAKAFSFLVKCGPLFFGVLFFAPVLTEIMNLLNISFVTLTNIQISLLIGLFWGSYASFKRSWI